MGTIDIRKADMVTRNRLFIRRFLNIVSPSLNLGRLDLDLYAPVKYQLFAAIGSLKSVCRYPNPVHLDRNRILGLNGLGGKVHFRRLELGTNSGGGLYIDHVVEDQPIALAIKVAPARYDSGAIFVAERNGRQDLFKREGTERFAHGLTRLPGGNGIGLVAAGKTIEGGIRHYELTALDCRIDEIDADVARTRQVAVAEESHDDEHRRHGEHDLEDPHLTRMTRCASKSLCATFITPERIPSVGIGHNCVTHHIPFVA